MISVGHGDPVARGGGEGGGGGGDVPGRGAEAGGRGQGQDCGGHPLRGQHRPGGPSADYLWINKHIAVKKGMVFLF